MILLCGVPSERPLAMVAAELEALGTPYLMFNQRTVAQCTLAWQIRRGTVSGTLHLDGTDHALPGIDAAYVRLMDDRVLPELRDEPPDSPARLQSRGFHDALYQWLEIAPGRIVNRAEPQGSNGSKPYQAQLIAAHGFFVPETLITNDPLAVLEFQRRHGTVIYKSISAVRSIVHALDADDLSRLDRIRWCPVQFQALVPGVDIRVHVVGRAVFATEIVSDRIDYRYARKMGGTAELRETELSPELAARCVALAAELGLPFVGIDLKRTPDGEFYCFEVNPCPAFSYFEANTGQPIARAVAQYLAQYLGGSNSVTT